MAIGGSRTLKLALLAEVADFSKNLKSAQTDTQSLGDQFEAFGKKAGLAFAAVGAAVGLYAKQAIENAAADEAAQRKLAMTIENTTTATASQIAGVEKYISTTSIAIGITDDQLRPAFGRLVRSTKDVEDAQRLLNLALDISAATGKPLEAIANSLGKAYDGNLNALGRLGLGIDQSILKSKDFDLVYQNLTTTFGGFADNEAQSTEKAFERIKIAQDEIKEQIGAALLPAIRELTDFILAEVVPVVQTFVDGLTGATGLTEGLSQSQLTALEWGKRLRGVIATVIDFKDELIVLGGVIAAVFTVSKISAGVTATIAAIKLLMTAYNALKASAIVTGVATAFALNPLLGVGAVALAAAVLSGANALANNSNIDLDALDQSGGAGGLGFPSGFMNFGSGYTTPVTGTKAGPTDESIARFAPAGADRDAALARIAAKESGFVLTSPFNAGTFRAGEAATLAAADAAASLAANDAATANRIAAAAAASNPTVILTVNGAVDPEGTARTIVNTLNNSFFRGTGGANTLAFE